MKAIDEKTPQIQIDSLVSQLSQSFDEIIKKSDDDSLERLPQKKHSKNKTIINNTPNKNQIRIK